MHMPVRAIYLYECGRRYVRDVNSRQRMERIIERCPSLQMRYWPTWYAHTAFQQLLLLGLKELRSALQLRFYKRQPPGVRSL